MTNPTKTARVLITGSRNWGNRETIYSALENELRARGAITVVHGGARGADSIAGEWAKAKRAAGFNVSEEVHPAQWNTHGRAAGPIRNQKMIDLGAEIVLAFPLGESRGTRHAMKASRLAGLKVKEF